MKGKLFLLLEGIGPLLILVFILIAYFSGRRQERKHLDSLAEREAKFASVLIFESKYAPPTTQTLDPVLLAGQVVVASDLFRSTLASLRKFFGGNMATHEALLARGRREAILRLKEHATLHHCKLVVNVRLISTSIQRAPRGGNSAVEIMAVGTGLVVAKSTPAQSKVVHQAKDEHAFDGPAEFDLAKNKTTRASLFLMVLALAYGAVELFTIPYWYASGALWHYLSFFGAIAFGVSFTLKRSAKVPMSSCVAMSLIWFVLVLGIGYFGMLRVNMLTSESGPQKLLFVYRAESRDFHLDERHKGVVPLPIVDMRERIELRKILKSGDRVSFNVLKGKLGFWQVEIKSVVEAKYIIAR